MLITFPMVLATVPPEAGEKLANLALPLTLAVTVLVLAMLLGLEIIQKVPTQLHTPLMSGSNAISGITIIGALIAAGAGTWLGGTFGLLAVIAAMVNVAGGYLVTDRMLRMFKRKR